MSEQVDIGLLRGLHAASTQGEWKLWCDACTYGDNKSVVAPHDKHEYCVLLTGNHNFPDAAKADAAWAVATHNALPALLDELERLREYQATNLAIKQGMMEMLRNQQAVNREADSATEQDRWQTPGGEQIGPNAYRYNMRDFMDGGGADEQREEATHG